MRVKICGITRIQDALAAVDLGANALGFVFVPSSRRFIPPEKAREIIRVIPPYVTTVGVFVDAAEDEVRGIVEQTGVAAAQFHGSEPPAYLRRFPFPVYKAFRVNAGFDVAILRDYPGQAFLLDTFAEGNYGGTGKSMDWSVAARGARYGRIILAGGLTATSVAAAIRCARPYAVDVSSGVESSPGVKDVAEMLSFMKAVRSAEFCRVEMP
jgi:phosphoribosylanthranilate isomerase